MDGAEHIPRSIAMPVLMAAKFRRTSTVLSARISSSAIRLVLGKKRLKGRPSLLQPKFLRDFGIGGRESCVIVPNSILLELNAGRAHFLETSDVLLQCLDKLIEGLGVRTKELIP
jgi:hypothetical protein